MIYNDDNEFCVRSLGYEYLNRDPRISSKTNFFAAASIVTNVLGTLGQSEFMIDVSRKLESLNIGRAAGIISGRISASGSIAANTAEFVHFEQSEFQTMLNELRARNSQEYDKTIADSNTAINDRAPYGLDRNFASAVRATQKALGRDIDSASQSDREALGNAVAAEAAKHAQYCTGTRLRTC
jgi:hypothetical protein